MSFKEQSTVTHHAVVVTGTPGTGKTIISKKLARELHAGYVSLTNFVKTEELSIGFDSKRQTRIIDLRRTRTRLNDLLAETSGTTIIDTHIPDAIPKQMVSSVIVLRCHPRVLELRLRKKGWRSEKVHENVMAEILDSCYMDALNYYGVRRVAQFDTSNFSVRECVSLTKKILLKGRTSDKTVNWIATLEREHTLDMYLV
jgi:adenylate kinase